MKNKIVMVYALVGCLNESIFGGGITLVDRGYEYVDILTPQKATTANRQGGSKALTPNQPRLQFFLRRTGVRHK